MATAGIPNVAPQANAFVPVANPASQANQPQAELNTSNTEDTVTLSAQAAVVGTQTKTPAGNDSLSNQATVSAPASQTQTPAGSQVTGSTAASATNSSTPLATSTTTQQQLNELYTTLQQLGIIPPNLSLFSLTELLPDAGNPAALLAYKQLQEAPAQPVQQSAPSGTVSADAATGINAPVPALEYSGGTAASGATQLAPLDVTI